MGGTATVTENSTPSIEDLGRGKEFEASWKRSTSVSADEIFAYFKTNGYPEATLLTHDADRFRVFAPGMFREGPDVTSVENDLTIAVQMVFKEKTGSYTTGVKARRK